MAQNPVFTRFYRLCG